MKRSWRFSLILTAGFLAAAGMVAWHHELWRDEMQAWLIARDRPNLPALALQGRYDGTPPLWYFLLRPLTLITHRPEAMQVLNWALAGLTFFFFCHFAPFTRLQKILLPFNYYLFYEYGTVSRQYLAGILFLAVACLAFPASGKNPWLFTLALVAAALTSVYGLILAVAMAAAFWADAVLGRAAGRRRQLLPFLTFTAGTALAVFCMWPEPDTFYAPANAWIFQWDPERLARVACAFTNAHFLLPRPEGHFWIPAWLTPLAWPQYVAIGLALPLLVVSGLLLRRSRPAVIFYAVATLGVSLFLYLKYLGFTRHVGFLFITFLLAVWLKRQLSAEARESAPASASPRGPALLLTAMLATQAVTGAWAARTDWTRDFSCGLAAANALKSAHLENAFIAVWPDSSGATIAGYLDRTVYYPKSHREGSFVRWDRQYQEEMTDAEALALAEQRSGSRPLVLVLDHDLTPEFMKTHGVTLLERAQGSLVPFEDYFLYLQPKAGAPVPAVSSAGSS